MKKLYDKALKNRETLISAGLGGLVLLALATGQVNPELAKYLLTALGFGTVVGLDKKIDRK